MEDFQTSTLPIHPSVKHSEVIASKGGMRALCYRRALGLQVLRRQSLQGCGVPRYYATAANQKSPELLAAI